MNYVIFFLYFLISQAQAYSSCSKVDLSSELPPIADQRKTGWCYAYASSDVASYILNKEFNEKSERINYVVSPASVALNYEFTIDNASFNEFKVESLRKRIKEHQDEIDKIRREYAQKYFGSRAITDSYAKYLKRGIEKYGRASGMWPEEERDKIRDRFEQTKRKTHAFLRFRSREYRKLSSNLEFKIDSLTKQLDDYMSHFTNEMTNTTLNGGFPKQTLENLQKYRHCLESEINSDKAQYIEYLWNDGLRNNSIICEALGNIYQTFGGILGNFDEILDVIDYTSYTHPISQIERQACGGEHGVIIPDSYKFYEEKTNIEKAIINNLENNRPVIVSIKADDLFKWGSSYSHAMTISGIDTCSFPKKVKVKNSWGKNSCEQDKLRLDSFIGSPKFSCEDGYYVFNLPDLTRATHTVTHYKKINDPNKK